MERRMHGHFVAMCAALCLLLLAHGKTVAQGINNLWMGGYDSQFPIPAGGTDLHFTDNSVLINYVNRPISFFRTNTNITDTAGNLLFSTNGVIIANAANDTMLNGSGLSPSDYTADYSDGLLVFQGVLILPSPNLANKYYLIHGTWDDYSSYSMSYLYYSTIDMDLDAGMGGVVSKNQVVISDTMNIGRITAVKHANGRDWWVIVHKAYSNRFYRLLLNPDGLSLDGFQDIGVVRPADDGQVCFSPDGSKFAYFGVVYQVSKILEVFDFDRCTGLFSNPVSAEINDFLFLGGVAFSPTGQFLYVSSFYDVYQFNMAALDIPTSQIHIAHWDSTYSPFPPYATIFDISQLAPDGKIYIGTGGGTLRLHVINNPDQLGLACNLVQHGITTPTYYASSLPNHPNYFLGPLAGSPCDTLALAVSGLGFARPTTATAYPNPTTGTFNLSYAAQPTVGELEVRDVTGRVVLRDRLPQWSTGHAVSLAGQAAGLYNCSLRWGSRSGNTRIMLATP
ncbi:MAG: T9SS type A sorting domain-containing protein [Flavobacteriales bacterium]|nr:T9SS type A sorting domain-containing protein [Flavobacteriales bacterium]